MQEMQGRSLGQEDLEKEMTTHSSILFFKTGVEEEREEIPHVHGKSGRLWMNRKAGRGLTALKDLINYLWATSVF